MGDRNSKISSDGDRLAELAEEFLGRHRAGESPSIDEYARKYPELAGEMRDLFPAMLAMEQPLPGATLDSTPPAERVGATIGRYKLLERIGEGGFGVVYMAEQQTPVRRKVAVKVIKPGIDTRQVIARFEAERQALALMDHENIAKVLDAGSTDAGRPYFVMELVLGVPITEYCDRNELPPRERLELFVQVCHAVQHAHQKGIIHRDIKPSNVLVTPHEGMAVPKVIDFGVAKATGQRLTEKTLFTNFQQMVGTPLYMSPEQAEMTAVDVDTRSDVYSLGVLLYELLTGTTPVDKERLKRAAFDEVRRIIREEEPPRPSTRLSTMGELARSVSASRKSDPKQLGRIVRGELDWIVMKALEKDRGRRYETANGLAMDVHRYLHDEPVAACPPSATYRLRKLARRYRAPISVAAGFLALLVAGTVVSTYQAIRVRAEQGKTLARKLEADRHRDRAEQERDRAGKERDRAVIAEQKALTEAHKSEQVATFMTEMLQGVGPSAALGRDTTMLREVLDNTTRRLDELKGQPAVAADLRMVLGDVYYDLGEFQSAEAMFRAALALRRGLRGNKHVEVAITLSELGEAIRKQGRLEESEPLFEAALAMQRELLGDDHPSVGLTLFRLGMVHNRGHRGAKAEPLLREALAIYRGHPSESKSDGGRNDRKSTEAVLDQLALSLTYQRRYAEAEPIARECLAILKTNAPSGNPLLAGALYTLGALLRGQGKPAEAEPYYREALEIRRKQLPGGHQDTLWSMDGLALTLIACGRVGEAVPLIDEFARLAVGKAELQAQLPRLLRARGTFFRQTGRLKEAAADFQKVTELAAEDFWNWYELAALYLYVGDVERYRAACLQLLDRYEKVSQEKPETALMVAKACALAPDSVPDFTRAERLVERSVTGTESHQLRRWFVHGKGLIEYRAGRHEQAIEWMRSFNPQADGTHWDGSGFAVLAMAHHRHGHADEARASLGAARAILAKKPPDAELDWSWRDWLHCEILCREAETLIGAVSPEEAAAAQQRMLDGELAKLSREVERKPGDAKPHRARATFFIQAGRFREAAADLGKATALDPGNYVIGYDAATLYLSIGDVERYRGACRELLDRFEGSKDPLLAERVAKACALAPDSVADFSRVERLAERTVTGTEDHAARRWFVLVEGLSEYRAGRLGQSVEWLRRFAPRANGTHSDGTGFAVLAMAHHRLGHVDEARASLEAARAVVAKKPPDAIRNASWRDWLHCEILCREAEQLLGGRSTPQMTKSPVATTRSTPP